MCNFLKKLFKKKDRKQEEVLSTPKLSDIIIFVDNGHGNDTKGKASPYALNKVEPAINFYEWKWNREIAKMIVDDLVKLGYDARILVPENNDVSLKTRVQRVNKICDEVGTKRVILVSIHSNASGNGKKWMNAKGWSAYTSIGNTKSDKLAQFLYDAAKNYLKGKTIRTDTTDGDDDYESNFYILKNTKCTAVLTENFFYDNVYDVQYILSEEGKKKIVETHVNGIINYIKKGEQ